MRYAAAAIILSYGLVCLLWPAHVLRFTQGRLRHTLSEGYVRGSQIVLRLVGLAILVGVPALFLTGYAS
jgi:hypothetical protein